MAVKVSNGTNIWTASSGGPQLSGITGFVWHFWVRSFGLGVGSNKYGFSLPNGGSNRLDFRAENSGKLTLDYHIFDGVDNFIPFVVEPGAAAHFDGTWHHVYAPFWTQSGGGSRYWCFTDGGRDQVAFPDREDVTGVGGVLTANDGQVNVGRFSSANPGNFALNCDVAHVALDVVETTYTVGDFETLYAKRGLAEWLMDSPWRRLPGTTRLFHYPLYGYDSSMTQFDESGNGHAGLLQLGSPTNSDDPPATRKYWRIEWDRVAVAPPTGHNAVVAQESPTPTQSAVASAPTLTSSAIVGQTTPAPVVQDVVASAPTLTSIATVTQDAPTPTQTAAASVVAGTHSAIVAQDAPTPTQAALASVIAGTHAAIVSQDAPTPTQDAVAAIVTGDHNAVVGQSSPTPTQDAVATLTAGTHNAIVAQDSPTPTQEAVASVIAETHTAAITQLLPAPVQQTANAIIVTGDHRATVAQVLPAPVQQNAVASVIAGAHAAVVAQTLPMPFQDVAAGLADGVLLEVDIIPEVQMAVDVLPEVQLDADIHPSWQ